MDIIDTLFKHLERILDIPYILFYAIGGIIVILYLIIHNMIS